MQLRRLLHCALLVALALTGWGEAHARTWTVEKDGSGDFTIVQDALDAAADGDTVQVGVGRFDDFAMAEGNQDLFVIAHIKSTSILVLGAGRSQTVLGPETRIPDTLNVEYNIFRLEPGTAAEIRGLSMENSRVALNNSGRLTLEDVRVSGQWAGVFDGSAEPLIVRNSHFEECSDYGILGGYQNTVVEVEDCSFFNVESGVFFNVVENGAVRRCVFQTDETIFYQRRMVAITQGSFAIVEDCRFLVSPQYWGVDISNARGVLIDNYFEPGRANISVRYGGHLSGSGNVLLGGDKAAVFLFDRSAADFHGNDIYSQNGVAVEVDAYLQQPIGPLDFTGNWWGTTDADSIAAAILYGNISEGVNADVLWQPFLEEPVPVEAESVGTLKSLFRRR